VLEAAGAATGAAALELGVLDSSLFMYMYAPTPTKINTKQQQRKMTAIIAIVPPSIYMYT
jgi:hypothetical protein